MIEDEREGSRWGRKAYVSATMSPTFQAEAPAEAFTAGQRFRRTTSRVSPDEFGLSVG